MEWTKSRNRGVDKIGCIRLRDEDRMIEERMNEEERVESEEENEKRRRKTRKEEEILLTAGCSCTPI